MEVMNSNEFEENSVLIGQQLATQAFGVSNDPMLMSMLSTGLYQFPLKTMLQEISFNAWDAHRMGNCQDRPIDVYMNNTTGLIIRDYGPGISPDLINKIYCIYGNSTKRDDTGQTGGFGLGSKSPFAYTDSFTVTSHFEGKKSMYLIKRSMEENNGGPGMITLLSGIPTEETGLLVTVGFKTERDIQLAEDLIKEVYFLSGIKANLHIEDKDVEYIESDSLASGEFFVDTDRNRSNVVAVYGGVKYEIPDEDTYTNEYKFFRRMSDVIGTVYIGFAPNTLTPLPNREGLNMSERSVLSVQSQLEKIQENLKGIAEPALKAVFEATATNLKNTGIDPTYIMDNWTDIGDRRAISGTMHQTVLENVPPYKPDYTTDTVWNSVLQVAYKKTSQFQDLIGAKKFRNIRRKSFFKVFPEMIRYRHNMMKPYKSQYYHNNANPPLNNQLVESNHSHWNRLLMSLRKEINQDKILFRVNGSDGSWDVVTPFRAHRKGIAKSLKYHKRELVKRLIIQKKTTQSDVPIMSSMWLNKSGEKIRTLIHPNHIFIARTVGDLADSGLRKEMQKIFAPETPQLSADQVWTSNNPYNFNPYNFRNFLNNSSIDPFMAVVVPDRKGAFEKAVNFFQDLGVTVHEVEEAKKENLVDHVSKTFMGPQLPAPKKVAAKRGPPVFPMFNPEYHEWIEPNKEMTKPQGYFCMNVSEINGYSWNRVSIDFLRAVKAEFPRLTLLHNKQREPVAIRREIPHLKDLLKKKIDTLMNNTDRMEKLYAHYYVSEHSNLPPQMLAQPEIQKLLKIPYLRTREAKQFYQDMKLIWQIIESRTDLVETEDRKRLSQWKQDMRSGESLSSVRKACENTFLFDKDDMESMCAKLKPGQIKVLSEKVSRFIRTV